MSAPCNALLLNELWHAICQTLGEAWAGLDLDLQSKQLQSACWCHTQAHLLQET